MKGGTAGRTYNIPTIKLHLLKELESITPEASPPASPRSCSTQTIWNSYNLVAPSPATTTTTATLSSPTTINTPPSPLRLQPPKEAWPGSPEGSPPTLRKRRALSLTRAPSSLTKTTKEFCLPKRSKDDINVSLPAASSSATTDQTPQKAPTSQPETKPKKRDEEADWAEAIATSPRPHYKRRSFPNAKDWNPSVVPSWFLYPTGNYLYEVLNYIVVAPLTLVTPLNLFYQIYLMEIFHTNFVSRGIHCYMMPLISWTYLLFAAQIELPFFTAASDAVGVNVLEIRGNALLAVLWFAWYLYWGYKSKAYCFGFFMIPHLLMLWLSSNVFYLVTRYTTPDATWYNSAPLWANPITLAFVFASIQTFSHIAEDLPPRMNGTDHWMTFSNFFNLHWNRKWYIVLIMVTSIPWGIANEYLAGPRLLPLLVLRQMYTLGYQQERWREIKKVVKMARESADPAIDYVGEGGALPPLKTEPPRNLDEALKELQELKWRRERNKQFEDEDEEVRIAYILLLIKKFSEKVSELDLVKAKEEPKERNAEKQKEQEKIEDEEVQAEEEEEITGETQEVVVLQKDDVHAHLVAVANKLALSSPAELRFTPTRC